jgi:hypothetical protein
MALAEILNELDHPVVDEQHLAALLNKIEQNGASLAFHFNDETKKWNASLATGDDLFYYGVDFTLPKAIAEAIRDSLKRI